MAAPTARLPRDECDRPDKHRPSGSDSNSGQGDGLPTPFLRVGDAPPAVASLLLLRAAVNLRFAHTEHLDKGGCQMMSARLPHLEGVGVEQGPADESQQSSATQPPNLRGSGVAAVGRPVLQPAAGVLPKKPRG